MAAVVMQIVTDEPRPPRQVDDTIPRELERICLKALARRASERYTTAKDLAEDLRHWISSTAREEAPAPVASRAEAELAPTPGLGKDAFLSYASPDQKMAFQLCRLLEERG